MTNILKARARGEAYAKKRRHGIERSSGNVFKDLGVTLRPGIYFDCQRGWHIDACVVELAVEYGYTAPADWPEAVDALKVLKEEGKEAFEQHCGEVDCELLHTLYLEAERFLDDLAPAGHVACYSEWGDWGVYELEEDSAE